MTAAARLELVALDAADITALASFYTELTGGEVVRDVGDWITVRLVSGQEIAFQRAPDHVPPQWPGQEHPQQFHLDLLVDGHEAAAARAVELGATRLAEGPSWITLADPAGHPFDLCRKEDDPNTTLMGVMLDCPDAKALSAFYSELLGKPVTYEADGVAMIGDDGAQPVLFQQVADYTAPRWPDPAYPQQYHLDVLVGDLDEGERAVLALGARRLPGGGDTFRVFADPADKPFCLVRQE
jgi:catechol-2,3-dioxygenase